MKYLIGIDEVGRGPIAGPVAVGAFIVCEPGEKEARKSLAGLFRGVKESKQISEKKREEWFSVIEGAREAGKIDFAVSFQSERAIDTHGISHCIKKCLSDALGEIIAGFDPDFHPDNFLILLDGGLKAPSRFKHQETIIRGDDKEPVIALASICAKVIRDRHMSALAKKHPDYGFDLHKGYGTKAHYAAIEKYGLIATHRKSFLSNL